MHDEHDHITEGEHTHEHTHSHTHSHRHTHNLYTLIHTHTLLTHTLAL